MKDVSASEGRTILFVSHDLAAINSLTSRAICLRNGLLHAEGNTTDVVNQYLQVAAAETGIYSKPASTSKPVITRMEVITSEPGQVHKHGEQLEILLDVHMPEYHEGMSVSLQVFNEREVPIIFTYAFDNESPILRQPGQHRLRCILPHCRLYMGNYFFNAHLAESKGRTHFDSVNKVCSFEVQMLDKIIEWGWRKDLCAYTEDFRWEEVDGEMRSDSRIIYP